MSRVARLCAGYAFATGGSSWAISQTGQMIRNGGVAVVVGMPSNQDVEFTLKIGHMANKESPGWPMPAGDLCGILGA